MIEALDSAAGALLLPLAVWVLISGIDDFVIAIAWLAGPKFRWPSEEDLSSTPRKRIAILVPLWNEHRVIAEMLSHNVAAIRYDDYDFFVGVYRNDEPTLQAVQAVQNRFANVHLALCPHDGPTTKADCLNWIYQRMVQYEREHEARFEIVVTHDAEDLIHPESLRLINYYCRQHDMVQIPVLPLPTPLRKLTHGLYCDEFAEFHTKDVPVRRTLRGFIPSCGVGTGFTRDILEMLARSRANRVFEPECLTEDYENGLAVHKLERSQLFVPVRRWKGSFVATREYFPKTFRSAMKQRTRWTVGIALQSWERHGWRGTLGRFWCFLHDRKPLVGNFVSPLANLLFLYGLAAWIIRDTAIFTRAPLVVTGAAISVACMQVIMRTACSARVYGWVFAAACPVRAVWGNWLNACATVAALRRYASARFSGTPLVWVKTEHIFPDNGQLLVHKRRLGEILVDSGYLSQNNLETSLRSCPLGRRIGEYLISQGLVEERTLYAALARQHALPDGVPREISREAARAIPVRVAREWQVLPFRISSGELHVAGSQIPSDEVRRDLRRFCTLKLRFRLVAPSEMRQLLNEHLPESA